jgi:hypothetical protein
MKEVTDAVALRKRLSEQFEMACFLDSDEERKNALQFVVVGAGCVLHPSVTSANHRYLAGAAAQQHMNNGQALTDVCSHLTLTPETLALKTAHLWCAQRGMGSDCKRHAQCVSAVQTYWLRVCRHSFRLHLS